MDLPIDDDMIDPTTPAQGLLDEYEIPNLATVPANELKRLTEDAGVAAEQYGQVYASLFRQLQLKPEKYADFHNGVLRVIRNKNEKLVKTGTAASARQLTELLIRGYRNIVWTEGSDWLLGDDELDPGEVRLRYRKKYNNRATDEV
jgi:hypothetical protein